MASKRERMLVIRALDVIKAQGEISSWDLSNEIDLPMSSFNNILRPILRSSTLIKRTKDKKWAYRYEETPEPKQPDPQMSIEDWIKTSN